MGAVVTGVDKDLATLRPPLEADATPIGRDWVEYAKALEAELSRLEEERRHLSVNESAYYDQWKAAEAELSRLREELHMTKASRDDWERKAKGRGVVQYELLTRAEAAEARCARLQQALGKYARIALLAWEATGGTPGVDATDSWNDLCRLLEDEPDSFPDECREALAGPDTPADSGERCEICGERGNIDYRGWFDDGSPMRTCNRDACRPPRQATTADSQEDKT